MRMSDWSSDVCSSDLVATAGGEILGERAYASLDDLPATVDMVDVFRNSEAAGPVTDAAIAHGAKVVWMQLGVRNDDAAARAEARSEEHTSELQSLMRISYAVFCLKKKKKTEPPTNISKHAIEKDTRTR